MIALEKIAWMQTRMARVRGLLSSETYYGILDALNVVHGEITSLSASLGHASAEIDMLHKERDLLNNRIRELTVTLETRSIVETERVISDALVSHDAPPGTTAEDLAISVETGAISIPT